MARNDDLLFFGKVSAQVSHELKNILAVINEQAGLLADFAMLAGRGMPLDPERLAATADCLQRQVRRGDGLLASFNRFAHSPDQPDRQVSLSETAELAAALGARRASTERVALAAVPGCDATIVADPFLLCRLLLACLERALAAPDAARSVTVAAQSGPDGAALVITGLGPDAAPGEDETTLAQALGASLSRDDGRLTIVWPAKA